jgi:hypothetical protein
MARTAQQIQAEMLNAIAANNILALLLTSTSLSAIYRNFCYIIAVAISFVENLFDTHKAEIDNKIYTQKSGRLPWYKDMAVKFQYGFALVTDHDYYDNTGFTDEQIEASKVVKYAAVAESETESRVIIKIAGEASGILAPLSAEQKAAFDAYMKEIKRPRKLTVINYLPDRLYLNLKIQYDGQLLDESGMSILNADYPVDDALAEFMKELPFDGKLRLSALIDKLQATEGVVDATLVVAETSWIDPENNDYGDPVPIDIAIVPQSGYFTIESVTIQYYT